jgi:hypothetical protein
MKFVLLAVVVVGGAALLATSAAEAKNKTVPCHKDLSTGFVTPDENFDENYTYNVLNFHERSRSGNMARGTCVINLKYSPPD